MWVIESQTGRLHSPYGYPELKKLLSHTEADETTAETIHRKFEGKVPRGIHSITRSSIGVRPRISTSPEFLLHGLRFGEIPDEETHCQGDIKQNAERMVIVIPEV